MPHPQLPAGAPGASASPAPSPASQPPPVPKGGRIRTRAGSRKKESLRTIKLVPRQKTIPYWEPDLEHTTDGRAVLPFAMLLAEWRELRKRAGARRARQLWDFVQARFVHYFADEAAGQALRNLRTADQFHALSRALARDCMERMREDPDIYALLAASDAYGVAWVFVVHRAPYFILSHFGGDLAFTLSLYEAKGNEVDGDEACE